MPSHTFTRVGYWQESIDANLASAAAARKDNAASEELHALDYHVYAYLQTAQDQAARKVVGEAPAIGSKIQTNAPGAAAPAPAGFFALAAIPARYTLERNAWAEAAALTYGFTMVVTAVMFNLTWFYASVGRRLWYSSHGRRGALPGLLHRRAWSLTPA